MDSPSAEGWEEIRESVSDEETGFDMGSRNEAKTRQRKIQDVGDQID